MKHFSLLLLLASTACIVAKGQDQAFQPVEEFSQLIAGTWEGQSQNLYTESVDWRKSKIEYGCLDLRSVDYINRLNKVGARMPRLQAPQKEVVVVEKLEFRRERMFNQQNFILSYQPCSEGYHFVQYGHQGIHPVVDLVNPKFSDIEVLEWSAYSEGFDALKIVHSIFHSNQGNARDFQLRYPSFYSNEWLDKRIEQMRKDDYEKLRRLSWEDRLELGDTNIYARDAAPKGKSDRVQFSVDFDGVASGNYVRLTLRSSRSSQFGEEFRWSGNFKIIGCFDSQQNRLIEFRRNRRIESTADIVADPKRLRIPGLMSCVFESEFATTDQVGFWDEDKKRVVPDLNSVRIEMNQRHAIVEFFSMGKKYSIEKISRNQQYDQRQSASPQTALNDTLEILWGAMRELSRVAPVDDTHTAEIGTVSAYLLLNRDRLRENSIKMSQNLANGSNFFQTLDTLISLRRAYRELDRAIGLVSDGFHSLDQMLGMNSGELAYQTIPRAHEIQYNRSHPDFHQMLGRTITLKQEYNTGPFANTAWEILRSSDKGFTLRLVDAPNGRWKNLHNCHKAPYLYAIPKISMEQTNKRHFMHREVGFPERWEVVD